MSFNKKKMTEKSKREKKKFIHSQKQLFHAQHGSSNDIFLVSNAQQQKKGRRVLVAVYSFNDQSQSGYNDIEIQEGMCLCLDPVVW